MIEVTNVILLIFMLIVAVAVLRLRNLFAAVMLTGIFSLLSASLLTLLDAVDVAFTEAAVGAGMSTVLMVGTLGLTTHEEKPSQGGFVLPLMAAVIAGAALIYGTLDMPIYGDPDAIIHQHVVPRYIEDSPEEIGMPNIVTSVLASYRGYDTLGETTVIFTAGVGVLLLLRGRKREDDP